jgi:hypothetical protein
MLQAALRAWPPAVVHDTVAAVVNSPDFRQSLQMSLAQRLWQWIADGVHRLLDFLRGSSSARTLAIGLAALLVLLVVARFVLAARARDDGSAARARGTRGRPGEDPWLAAERLAAAGELEAAAHAIYRGVLESLARADRVRLDPSKTSGDYARDLRARSSASYLPFRAFGRRFDVAVYGHGECDAAAIAELYRLAEPFRPRTGARAA